MTTTLKLEIPSPHRSNFPKDFIWGSATAAYQIEGAALEDGRSASIWDTFSHTPGKVKGGDTGDVACDHYHQLEGDLDLMKQFNLGAYRFSVSWSRILPQGRGAVNAKGLAFYDRLVDGLLERNITPWLTLYHWDLPQTLEDAGGWTSRDTVAAYLEYTEVLSKHLGDRVKHWITHNEPWCTAFLGNLMGIHAPGNHDLKTALQVSHHLLLSHGLAVPILRQNSIDAQVGITLNLGPTYAFTDSSEDAAAARTSDGFMNRWFLDPVYGKGYPQDMLEIYGAASPVIVAGDMEAIAVETDFLGINYYTRANVKHKAGAGLFESEQVHVEGDYTFFDWEVYPQGLTDLLKRVVYDYDPPAIYITENGATYQDVVGADGEINDTSRLNYFKLHLEACSNSIKAEVPLKGYFAWSLMDNFEWAEGYEKRFGLTYVDFVTLERKMKASGKWYSNFIKPE